MTLNPFEAMAERQMTGAAKAKDRAKQKWADRREAKEVARHMKPSPLMQKQMDAAALMKDYRKWRNSIKQGMIERYGSDFAELMRMLRNLSWSNHERVMEYTKQARWLHRADEDTRFETLRFIDASFCRSRIREGLPEFDDGMWDGPPSYCMRLKAILKVI